jgi:hypothetical protein
MRVLYFYRANNHLSPYPRTIERIVPEVFAANWITIVIHRHVAASCIALNGVPEFYGSTTKSSYWPIAHAIGEGMIS